MSVGAICLPHGAKTHVCDLSKCESGRFCLPHGAKIVPTKIAILAIFEIYTFSFAPWGETCCRRNRDFSEFEIFTCFLLPHEASLFYKNHTLVLFLPHGARFSSATIHMFALPHGANLFLQESRFWSYFRPMGQDF